jgi:hypothetical protein
MASLRRRAAANQPRRNPGHLVDGARHERETALPLTAQGLQVRLQARLVPGLRRLLGAQSRSPRRSRNSSCGPRTSRWSRASAARRASRLHLATAFTACTGVRWPPATGLKIARPDLTVLVASGDGDGYSIGGNHFLHACRRNVDLTYIVMDNHVYGMTKGQPSPTTEPDWTSKLMPAAPGLGEFHPLVSRWPPARTSSRAPSPATRTAGGLIVSGPPSGLLVRRGALALRHLPARSSASGRRRCTRRRSSRPTTRGAPRAPGHDRRRTEHRRAVQGRSHPVSARPARPGQHPWKRSSHYEHPKTSSRARSTSSWSRPMKWKSRRTQRYADFADAMETHNNREVTELFRKMSTSRDFTPRRSWRDGVDRPPAPASLPGKTPEGPETIRSWTRCTT